MRDDDRRPLVLNVDDDEAGRRAKTRALRLAGDVEVAEAATGGEALRLVAERSPSLVLLDAELPDIDGLEVCRRIKRDRPEVLVLQTSASPTVDGGRARGLDAGADAFLVQPAGPGELVASVRALLRIRRAEARLRESEERLRLVVDGAADHAIITTDGEGRITGWSSGAEAVFGWSTAEAVGKDAALVFTPEDRAAGVPGEEIETARRDGCANDERWHLRKDGRRVFMNGSLRPLHAADGAAAGFLKVARDETERRGAHETAARLAAIVFASPDAIVSFSCEDGRITSWNKAAERLFGYTEAEAIGGPVDLLLPPADRVTEGEDGTGVFRWAMRDGAVQVESVRRRKDGTLVDVAISAARMEAPDGRVLGVSATFHDITERKRAEAALREGEARFRAALAAAQLGTFEWDLRTDAVVLDERSREIFGFAAGEGTRAQEVFGRVDPEDSGRVVAEARASREAGSRLETEYRVRLPDGTGRDVASVSNAVLGAGGEAERMVGVFADVTARTRAEARRLALIELGDRIRDIEDPADLSFAAAEIMGRALGASRAGYGTIDPAAETITIERDWNAPGIKSLAGVLHFRDYGSYIEDLKRGETVVFADAEKDPRTAATADALKAISAQSVVNMPVTEQGGFVALLYLNHATAREWSADELAFVREVAGRTRTAVERRRAEGALRELAASLERLVEERTAERDRVWRNSRDLLVVVGADGVFRAANPAWKAILGHDPSAVAGRSFLDFVWPDDADLTRGGLDAAVSKRDLTNFENRYRHADGTPRWISWHTSAEGDLVYGYGRDVTAEKAQAEALRRAEEQLRQSQKMEAVGQLTGGIAHDFNNLLQIVTGNLEILGRNLPVDAGRLRRTADNAMNGAKRAATLTQRLLAFSRRQPLAPKALNVNQLVSSMSDLLNRALGETVALETVLAAGLWRVEADPNQLENAILNLAVNARDAMPNGGKLTVETANTHLDEAYVHNNVEVSPGQYVLVCVSDTGTGMEKATLAHAFEPFFTTKDIGKGTGLGLSQVYGFVKQSDGHVAIYSEPGEGTTVKIYLPRLLGAPAEELKPAEPAAPEGSRAETVLVLEDDHDVRAYTVEVLRELGYRVLEAHDGPTALRLLERGDTGRVDLLFTDVVLPGGMNGQQVAARARDLRPGLKVLFTTGYARNAIVHHGRLDPGVRLLTKPFTYADLAVKVRDLFDDPAP